MNQGSGAAVRVGVGVLIFAGLLIGGYLVGSTRAVSSTPVYITDSKNSTPMSITDASGSNTVSINGQGHLSVHLADPNLPPYTGPEGTTRIQFPVVSGLRSGQCYDAYFRAAGEFISASVVDHPVTGNGRPRVLVRLDRDAVWLQDGTLDSTPVSAATGVARSHGTLSFGFPYSLDFKSFVGVDVCGPARGMSDSFAVQITAGGLHGGVLYPESLLFDQHQHGSTASATWTHHWIHAVGSTPVGFTLVGTRSTEVSFYHSLAPIVRYHTDGIPYSAYSSHSMPRYYVFENQVSGDPIRIGPFGSWAGL